MKVFTPGQILLAAAALAWAALPGRAQDAPAIPAQPENRFLFVVDTSYAMRGYSNAVVQGVVELLASDMRGEFRPGDTIGLWLYNETLDPQYPMQVWSKADKDMIAADMAAFLRGRRYEKQAHLERVLPALNQVIKSSERITVILIFDGAGSIHGTPFDKAIRALQKRYARELRSARVPFITVLAARDGAVFDYTINYPGLVAIPHTANPEAPVVTNAPVAAIIIPVTNAPPPAPRPTNSIIMSRPHKVVQAAPPPVVPPPPPPLATPVVVVASPPAAPTPVIPAPVTPPAIFPATPPAREISPPQTQPVSPPASETAAAVEPPAIVAANGQPPPSAPPVAQDIPAANAGPAVGAPMAMIVMAFSLLAIAVVLVIFLVRRSRNAPHSSLITQSIDRPR